jgi:tetratricopeptide (TPR) repeat protein
MGGPVGDETLPLRTSAGESTAERFAIGSIAQGRYRIERFIAAGGMGEVYAAHDLLLDTTVALKTLRPELEGSADAIARLRREIALARSVTDPRICRLHDVGEQNGRVFLSMELLEGRTLAELVTKDGLGVDEVDRLAPQLIAGLGALHRASIIHRDFKTSNVIVVGRGAQARAVITDFGLARSIDAKDARLTVESGLLGTPAYMSPEQVEARPATTASDIYSLGVVLFELLTGRLPFDEDTAMATATARLRKDPPRPSSLRSQIPARWDAIVLRCLEREPAARFASVDEILGHKPRSRRWFLAAGGGAIAAAVLGVWRAVGSGADEPSTAIAPRSPDDTVAVLPVLGEGSWLTDAWRSAITFDLHDALATVGVPVLALYTGGMDLTAQGAASRLLNGPAPIRAAFELPNVTTVVAMTVTRTPSTIALAVTVEGRHSWQRTFTRPLAQAALLSYDVAVAIAMTLGYAPPRMPVDALAFDAARYERYGAAIARQHRRPTQEEWLVIDQDPALAPERLLRELVASEPALLRAAAIRADRRVMDAEQKEDVAALTAQLAEVEQLVARVLAADPHHALCHAVRGHAAMLRWDWHAADVHTQRAAELAPTHERVMYHRGFLLMMTGRFDEGLALTERTHARNPHQRLGNATLAWQYYYARRWPDLVRVVEPVVDKLNVKRENEAMCMALLALGYLEMSRRDQAVTIADRLRDEANNYVLAGIVPVYALAGRVDVARALRDKIGTDVDLGVQAVMADGLGELDKALDILERVVESHNIHAIFLQVERYSPQLQAHPRFQALLRRVGFPRVGAP